MINEQQFAHVWGRGVEAMFPPDASPVQVTPWPRAARSKTNQDYDPEVVRQALSEPPRLTSVDPRSLRATQPSVTAPGVRHYVESPEYERIGRTYADQDNPGNRFPVVYSRHPNWPERSNNPTNLLLSGHHRGASALVQGKQFDVIHVEGGWGPPRRRA